jgi:acyl carrier protein
VSDSESGAWVESKVTALVLEYALQAPTERPLRPERSLRDEIGIDSFALVSLMLRLGEELNVDLAEESARLGIDLQTVVTFGDLVRMAQTLSAVKTPAVSVPPRSA